MGILHTSHQQINNVHKVIADAQVLQGDAARWKISLISFVTRCFENC